jgi:hypothetical protein
LALAIERGEAGVEREERRERRWDAWWVDFKEREWADLRVCEVRESGGEER